ncbi:MAG: HEAT repeat domain-containing protein [Candidatus Norongarragalinales archaeon]
MTEKMELAKAKNEVQFHLENLSHKDPVVKQVALKQLAEIRDPNLAPIVQRRLGKIAALLKDPHPLTRSRAVDVLFLFGNYSVLDDLRKIVSNNDEGNDVRKRAELAIRRIGDSENRRFDRLFR